jgi:hypothetical protein
MQVKTKKKYTMTAKFIASSAELRRMLNNLDLDLRGMDEEMVIECKMKRLSINESKPICVEAREDFDFDVTVRRLLRLSKLCGMLEEQPLVIYYDHNRFLNIQNAVI